jgi:hypothetical protein
MAQALAEMSPRMEVLFVVVNLLVLPFWLLMIALPHWRWTRRIIASPLILLPLPVVYAVLLVSLRNELVPLFVNPTLAEVVTLFGTGNGALIAWVHLLAMDLCVGRWAYLDSRACGVSGWLMAPVLVLLMAVGPFGLMVYLGVRTFARPSRAAAKSA